MGTGAFSPVVSLRQAELDDLGFLNAYIVVVRYHRQPQLTFAILPDRQTFQIVELAQVRCPEDLAIRMELIRLECSDTALKSDQVKRAFKDVKFAVGSNICADGSETL